MAKIYLTKQEKKTLLSDGKLKIERIPYLSCPNTSIVFGIGTKTIFDKIDYCWVYGDVDAYILSKKNVGRRAVDYKDNTPNTWNGSHWYNFLGADENKYGEIGTVFTNGKKHPIQFRLDNIFIKELRVREGNPYSAKDIVLEISLSLV